MKDFNSQHAIIVALATLFISTLTLEYYGYINHSSDADRRHTGNYHSIILSEGDDYKMSSKTPDKHARCVQGFIALEFTHSGKSAGFLVDDKNRGIRCNPPQKQPAPATRNSET